MQDSRIKDEVNDHQATAEELQCLESTRIILIKQKESNFVLTALLVLASSVISGVIVILIVPLSLLPLFVPDCCFPRLSLVQVYLLFFNLVCHAVLGP